MPTPADKLIELHTRFYVDLLTAEGPGSWLAIELAEAARWLQDVEFARALPAAASTEFARASLARLDLTPDLLAVLRRFLHEAADLEHWDALTVGEVLPKELLERFVDHLESFEKVRLEAIEQLLSSTLFAEFLSDILYHSIKDYLLTENFFARRLPMASSLVKLGKGVMSKTAPKLEDAVEKTLKEYIAANLAGPLKLSQRFIEQRLSPEEVGELLRRWWDEHESDALSSFLEYIAIDDVADLTAISLEGLVSLRDLSVFEQLVADLIALLYEGIEKRSVGEVLGLAGLDLEELAVDLSQTIRPAIDQAIGSGFLESRIRAQAEAFYRSPDVAELLGG